MGNARLVLIHGSSHGAWCWEPLLPHLALPALAIDLPGRGRHPADLGSVRVADWVEAVIDEIRRGAESPVMLVGHSLAGITMPRVADRIPEALARIVYVSCTVPPEGKTVWDVLSPEIEKVALENAGVEVTSRLPDDVARGMFCNDMDEAQTRFVLERLVPDAGLPLREPMDTAGLRRGIPSTYLRLRRDQTVPPELQDAMIRTLRDPEVVELDAGHDVMVSQPAALAAVLNEIAERDGLRGKGF